MAYKVQLNKADTEMFFSGSKTKTESGFLNVQRSKERPKGRIKIDPKSFKHFGGFSLVDFKLLPEYPV